MAQGPAPATGTTAVLGSHVLVDRDGAQAVLRDHWVVVEGDRIAAVTPDRPAGADRVLDRPGRFVLPGLMNLHNHCFSEAVARTHTEDGAGRRNNQSIVYTVLLPLTKRGIGILAPAERMDVARLGILQLLKGVFARAGTAAAFGRFAGRGLRTLVGTDGYNMDLLGELNAAATVSKIVSGSAGAASAPELIAAVTREAAAAIGRPDLGATRPGAKADLTVVDLSGPLTQPLHDPRRALVWLANRGDLDAVMVDGRLLIEGGRSTMVDEAVVTRAGAAAIRKIWDLPEARAAFDG